MSQDGLKDELIRGHPDDGLGLLQVVLLSYDDKGERQKDGDRYAAIKFPPSYAVSPVMDCPNINVDADILLGGYVLASAELGTVSQ
jgi:hypothetical protein